MTIITYNKYKYEYYKLIFKLYDINISKNNYLK